MMEQESKEQSSQWSGKSRGGSFGYAFFVLLIKVLGVRIAYLFLAFVALYFIPFAPKSTAAIWRYNRRILGYGVAKSIIKIYIHYFTFGQTLIDKIAIVNGMSKRYKFEFDNYDEFLRLLDSGSVVMIGGHVGCWEIGAEFFGDYAHRLNVVMFDGEYDKIKERVDTSKFGYKIIPINGGGIESLLRIKQAIDAGEYICFQGDRYAEGGSSCTVKFMGHDAAFPLGPSLIASKFKTPIIFYFAMRERGRRYRFIFKTLDGGLSQQQILATYIEEFEGVVKRYPQQWFNFFDLWRYE
ncbi:MAG: acyltransferase [Rikenellaceae bacterium]